MRPTGPGRGGGAVSPVPGARHLGAPADDADAVDRLPRADSGGSVSAVPAGACRPDQGGIVFSRERNRRTVIDTGAIRMRGNRGGQQQATGPGRSGRKRVTRILAALERSIPQAKVELSHRNHLQLLVSTILSAQCTDQRVNQVTPKLFSRYRRAVDYAGADPAQLEAIIRPTGFYKSKARNLVACGRVLTEQFSGEVPDTMDALVTLPGVGRKTANVILGTCFGKPAVVVDTHVKRVSQRLGLAASGDPTRIEHALQQLIPRRAWTLGSQRLLLHGRYVCVARKPKCEECAVYSECNWAGKRPR